MLTYGLPPQYYKVIIFQLKQINLKVFFLKGDICRCNQVKDLEMRLSFLLTRMIPKFNDKCPFKSETEGDLTDRRGGGKMTVGGAIRVILATIS